MKKEHVRANLNPQQVVEALTLYIAKKRGLPYGEITGGEMISVHTQPLPLDNVLSCVRVEFDFTEKEQPS